MYQKAQDNFIDPGLLLSLKRKIIPGKPGAVDGRQLYDCRRKRISFLVVGFLATTGVVLQGRGILLPWAN